MTDILERLKQQPKVNGAYLKDIEDAIKEIEKLRVEKQDSVTTYLRQQAYDREKYD